MSCYICNSTRFLIAYCRLKQVANVNTVTMTKKNEFWDIIIHLCSFSPLLTISTGLAVQAQGRMREKKNGEVS